MLRLLALLLLLANGAYLAWSQGGLRDYGLAPEPLSEPQRMADQIRPEALHLLSAQDVQRMETAPSLPLKPPECLLAGFFNDAQLLTLRHALEPGLPAGSWQLEPATEAARWIVYMGKFPTADALAKKRAELATRNLRTEIVTTPALTFGLSIGGFETQVAANAELASLAKYGVRTARVVQERAEVRGAVLRFPNVDEALRARLEGLKPAWAGHPLKSCR